MIFFLNNITRPYSHNCQKKTYTTHEEENINATLEKEIEDIDIITSVLDPIYIEVKEEENNNNTYTFPQQSVEMLLKPSNEFILNKLEPFIKSKGSEILDRELYQTYKCLDNNILYFTKPKYIDEVYKLISLSNNYSNVINKILLK